MTFTLLIRTLSSALLLCCLLYGSFSSQAHAQVTSGTSSVHHWSYADGLPSNHINSLIEGPDGFVWIATRNGLSRFDGKEFYNYFRNPTKQGSLPSNYIEHIFFNKKGELWVGTDQGIVKFQPHTNSFLAFELPTPNLETNVAVKHISEDEQGRLLVSTQRSIYRFNPIENTFEPLNLTYNNHPIEQVHYMYRGKRWYWLSTEEDGLYVWDGFSQEVFALNKQNPIADKIPGSRLYSALYYREQLWMATDKGLVVLNNELRLSPLPYSLKNVKSPTHVHLTKSDDILLSTLSGLYKLKDSQSETLLERPFSAAIQITRGDIFAFSDDRGLFQIDSPFAPSLLASIARERSSNASAQIPKIMQQITAAVKDASGNWWLATELGLLFYDTLQTEISELNYYPNSKLQVSAVRLFADHLYLLTRSGLLYRYSLIDKSWSHISDAKLPADPNALSLTQLGQKIWLHTKTEAIAIDQFGHVSQRKLIAPADSKFTFAPHITSEKIGPAGYSVDFTVPFPAAPKELVYRYKFGSQKNPWQLLDQGSLQLKSLSPGLHRLEIQASINNQNWSQSAVVSLGVTRPLWQSPLAWVGYAFVAALICVSYFLWNRRKQSKIGYEIQQLRRQAKGLQSSGYQCWEWNLRSGELIRQNIWANCPAFPVDGKRLGFSGGQSNVHPEDLNRLQKNLEQHLNGQSDIFECTYRLDNQGSWLWVLDRGQLKNDEERQTMFGTLSDISSLVSSEERINMLASSITNISDGICIFDRFFRKREVNNAFERISGFQRDQVMGQLFALPCYPESFVNQIKRAVIKDGTWRGEITDVKADGDEFLMELTLDAVRDDNGEVSLIVASFSDITERRHTENELRRLSNTDTLTGLPNRSYFQVSHSNLVRKKVSHTLLLFDLDDFKKINDSLGHEIGDELLCQVAERLMDIGRRQDTLYRLGGDEFGLLIEDSVDINLIGDLGNQINLKVSEPYFIQQQEIVIGSSIGIVLYPHDGQTSQELLQKADMAMYHAKQRGGNCYQFFSQSMNENAVKRLKLENELRAALKANNIRVYYQPKIEISSGHIAGLEALARIESNDGSMISPAEFIPLAEETGLIIPLGEEVLRQSCQDMKKFMTYPGAPKSIAINLSARQFMQSSLALQIEQILREENLHPRHVEFEITEGMVMSDPERAITMMENLSDMGVKLALDDFGTGYSSLSYLKRFPMNSLKIDKAFVDDITINDKDRNMVASIIGMAHNLGLKVVAEGVETKAQLQTLKSLKCEYIQGFYFAKPMPADALIQFIEQHNKATAQA
ncbi:EAL domain-containing protein [Idiomarina sp. HP20-50]|uniref:EAL domain-containing protein n=1 Tax=Idiomarina sp. HP20-50 TaxID=3070813 RepID=UPI00294B22D8|nr:EAL domain-containing protein [Idiomarina sp. HP20-50]MDV6315525.1 EAL domain-containing protein [Idiomarina sp. HP20-50]